jgi:hypothetical protein
MSKSQRHTCSGAGRGVSQATGAAIHSKFPGLCQHEIVSETLKKWKQCEAVQASCGYLHRWCVHLDGTYDMCCHKQNCVGLARTVQIHRI